MKDKPRYLYKYYSNLEYALDVLINDRVYLNQAKEFNDIFDSMIVSNEILTYMPWSDETKDYILSIVHDEYKSDIESKLVTNYDSISNVSSIFHFLGALSGIEPKEKEHIYSKLLEKYCNKQAKWKIACFSRSNKSILMWAHYGNHLNGYCLRFDITKDEKLSNAVQKVNYSQERYNMLNEKLYFNKYGVWKYEKEWRYIENSTNMYLETKCCDAIIIGERCESNIALEVAKERGKKIFIAKADENKYKINVIRRKENE